MNRNTKRYPNEEINRLKKSGKRLLGGYVLTRLKNWKKRKATAKRVSVDLPATEILPPKKSITRPLKKTIHKQQRTTKAKTQKAVRAIPVNMEKPKQQRTTKAKTQKAVRAIPVNMEKPKQQRTTQKAKKNNLIKNNLIVETIKKADGKNIFKVVGYKFRKNFKERNPSVYLRFNNFESAKQQAKELKSKKYFVVEIDFYDKKINVFKPIENWMLNSDGKYTDQQKLLRSYPSFLMDNEIEPNTNAGEEIKAIASDIPAFGDDISKEQLELDSKLDLPDVQQNRNNMEIASAKDIRNMKFKSITLPSKYRQLLGKVPSNFRLLLWGAPGHGKSSLALIIANDIGKYVKTLYVSAEESLQSVTLASRIKRFKATARNLMFNDTNNPEVIEKIILTQNPKFIVIDSVNVMIGKTEAMINLMLKYPEIGFIMIAQATKDRKRYAGLGSLAHAVDIVVNVKNGIATSEKNRYSQLGSMQVKGIKI